MRIAIVDRKTSFSDRWLLYCKGQGIDYKIVDPYRNDIIQQVEDCDALMWHFHQSNYKDMQMAVALLTSVSKSGKKYIQILIHVGILIIRWPRNIY